MFSPESTTTRTSSPVLSDWTTRELLEWIAADDARCHDATLLGVLTAIDRALAGHTEAGASLTPTSPAPLVRALAARLRENPALRAVRLQDLAGVIASPRSRTAPERGRAPEPGRAPRAPEPGRHAVAAASVSAGANV